MLEKLKEIIADQLSVDESEMLWLWKRSMVVRSLQMT